MLGYVKIDKGELKVREYEIYTGYYCGICKSIGKRYGQLPRMVLSYDAAFLALFLASLDDETDTPSAEHCIARPAGKKKTVIRNRAIDYAGDVMLILAWHKLADDAKDEGRLYAKGTMAVFRRLYRRLEARYPALCRKTEEHLAQLSSLEADRCDSLDMAAEAFSKIMEAIFEEGFRAVYPERSDEYAEEAQLLCSIGYHMGKWIYLIDAVDDIEENIDSGAYNPLLYRFRYSSGSESPAEFRSRIEPDLRFNLYHYLAMLSNYANSLDIKKNKGIIENIIYFGLNRKTEEIITRTDKKKQI